MKAKNDNPWEPSLHQYIELKKSKHEYLIFFLPAQAQIAQNSGDEGKNIRMEGKNGAMRDKIGAKTVKKITNRRLFSHHRPKTRQRGGKREQGVQKAKQRAQPHGRKAGLTRKGRGITIKS